jgi:hypothetical protein
MPRSSRGCTPHGTRAAPAADFFLWETVAPCQLQLLREFAKWLLFSSALHGFRQTRAHLSESSSSRYFTL